MISIDYAQTMNHVNWMIWCKCCSWSSTVSDLHCDAERSFDGLHRAWLRSSWSSTQSRGADSPSVWWRLRWKTSCLQTYCSHARPAHDWTAVSEVPESVGEKWPETCWQLYRPEYRSENVLEMRYSKLCRLVTGLQHYNTIAIG